MGILPNDYSVERNKKSPEKKTRIAKSSESVMQQATKQFENLISGKRDRSFIGIELLNQYKKISPHLLEAVKLRRDVLMITPVNSMVFIQLMKKKSSQYFRCCKGRRGKRN